MTTETLSDYARFKRDVSAAERDDLAFKQWQWQNRIGTHCPGCYTWGPAHWQCAIDRIADLEKAAAQAVEAERSAILRAIDELEEPPYSGYENPNTFDDGCIAVADAIRARSTP